MSGLFQELLCGRLLVRIVELCQKYCKKGFSCVSLMAANWEFFELQLIEKQCISSATGVAKDMHTMQSLNTHLT